ncbi:MAG: hypothetical protein O2931_16855 [Planctomycetota bacterium]|nr:hypothetical protein [Planctomycetota bacterium]MDA1180452.1 hypothetical protein [Planctomycetota bacterium]
MSKDALRRLLFVGMAGATMLLSDTLASAANQRSANFLVRAPSMQLAREVVQAAEKFRRDLALEWLGHELPTWSEPCPIMVQEARDAGGETSFVFDGRYPSQWQMRVQGSRERILDSVLPHEVTHTIFATHFGQPLPRWADEGACTTVEHESERRKQQDLLIEFLMTDRGIPFRAMFAMREYPEDILPLYSQGFSLARFLIAQGGKPKFIQYVGDGINSRDWHGTTARHYGFKNLGDLQLSWLEWVKQGSPPGVRRPADNVLVAQTEPNSATATQDFVDKTNTISLASATRDVGLETESWYLQQQRRLRNETPSDTRATTKGQPAPQAASIETPQRRDVIPPLRGGETIWR